MLSTTSEKATDRLQSHANVRQLRLNSATERRSMPCNCIHGPCSRCRKTARNIRGPSATTKPRSDAVSTSIPPPYYARRAPGWRRRSIGLAMSSAHVYSSRQHPDRTKSSLTLLWGSGEAAWVKGAHSACLQRGTVTAATTRDRASAAAEKARSRARRFSSQYSPLAADASERPLGERSVSGAALTSAYTTTRVHTHDATKSCRGVFLRPSQAARGIRLLLLSSMRARRSVA